MVVLSEFYLVVLLLTTMTTFQGHTRGKPGSYKIFKLHTLVNSCPVHFKLRIHCLLMPTLIHVCFCFLKKEKRKKAVLKGDIRGVFCLDITFDFVFTGTQLCSKVFQYLHDYSVYLAVADLKYRF